MPQQRLGELEVFLLQRSGRTPKRRTHIEEEGKEPERGDTGVLRIQVLRATEYMIGAPGATPGLQRATHPCTITCLPSGVIAVT
jgi:hypothetical protein